MISSGIWSILSTVISAIANIFSTKFDQQGGTGFAASLRLRIKEMRRKRFKYLYEIAYKCVSKNLDFWNQNPVILF